MMRNNEIIFYDYLILSLSLLSLFFTLSFSLYLPHFLTLYPLNTIIINPLRNRVLIASRGLNIDEIKRVQSCC